jgi:hypothetical protein
MDAAVGQEQRDDCDYGNCGCNRNFAQSPLFRSAPLKFRDLKSRLLIIQLSLLQ